MANSPSQLYVSRAGLKLEHALREFEFDVAGLTCADFGCNVGGFTDCLLQRGAARVYAIDTGYNVLAWKLRSDPRVIVMERTNALHVVLPPPPGTLGTPENGPGGEGDRAIDDGAGNGVDLIVIDLAWTPQRLAIPAALRNLKGNSLSGGGHIITLVKPHYELDDDEKQALLVNGFLDPSHAEPVLQRVLEQMPEWGATPLRWTKSPLTGGKSARKGKTGEGNIEFLVLCARQDMSRGQQINKSTD